MQEKIDEMAKKVKDNVDFDLMEKMLQSNVFEFDIDEVKYRVKKPTFGQKQQVYKKKVEKFTQLLQDKTLMLESDLIKQYKERGIDIEKEIDQKLIQLEKQKQDYQLSLGKELEKKSPESELKTLRDEIADIEVRQTELSVRKTTLLQFSLEYQLNIYVYAYLTTLIAEKQVEDKWVKVWNSFEEFENSEEGIVNKITFYASLIIKDEILF